MGNNIKRFICLMIGVVLGFIIAIYVSGYYDV
jgi:hypothetical protein